MDRRQLLGALGGSLAVGMAGCINGNGDGDNGNGNGDGTQISGAFRAESTDGRVLFGEPDKEEWDDDGGYGLPPSGQITEPVVLEAELNDDNSWEATNVDFPPLNLEVESISPTIEAADFSGELDQEAGLWTVSGQLTVTAEIDGETYTLSFPLDATTGESGDLEGSYEEQDGKIVATIVDNESIVDDKFGDSLIDGLLNLPGEFEGDNWFSLSLEMENVEE